MSKILKFPTPKGSAEDYLSKALSDEIDNGVFGALSNLSIPMVGVILADRLGELLKLAGNNSLDQQKLKELYLELIDKKIGGTGG